MPSGEVSQPKGLGLRVEGVGCAVGGGDDALAEEGGDKRGAARALVDQHLRGREGAGEHVVHLASFVALS